MLYNKVAKPILFRMSAEKAHHLTLNGLNTLGKIPFNLHILEKMYGVSDAPELVSECFGLPFHSPIGLAAGLDKNAEAVDAFSRMGFGFMEVGTVTPRPQEGNPMPRLFRLPEDEALINRMGFNNIGIDGMARNLRQASNARVPIAINIGKNKDTPNEEAEMDYRACIRGLYSYGDFFVVNISSPNTPGLRNLQHGQDLRNLLNAVKDEIQSQHKKYGGLAKPVLVKIAPDLLDDDLRLTIETIAESGVSGIIATNTTIGREGIAHPNAKETGGLSGKPLRELSTRAIRRIYEITEGTIPIVGVGGIFTAEDAYEKIRSGASLIEIYTALIYKGPEINRQLYKGLQRLLLRDGFTHISQAVGIDV